MASTRTHVKHSVRKRKCLIALIEGTAPLSSSWGAISDTKHFEGFAHSYFPLQNANTVDKGHAHERQRGQPL